MSNSESDDIKPHWTENTRALKILITVMTVLLVLGLIALVVGMARTAKKMSDVVFWCVRHFWARGAEFHTPSASETERAAFSNAAAVKSGSALRVPLGPMRSFARGV